MEVKLGLEGRSILVLGGLKPPGHGDAGRRSRAGGLSEARSVWHVCPCVCRSEAKQCDSAPAAWFVYLSSCAHTVPQAQPAAPFLPCVQSSLLRESLTAGIRSIPGVCCPAAELALPGGGSVGGSPHLTSTSALPAQHPPWDTPTTSDRGVPVLHHSLRLSPDECCGCCRGHCTLSEAAAAASWRHRLAQKYSETASCS